MSSKPWKLSCNGSNKTIASIRALQPLSSPLLPPPSFSPSPFLPLPHPSLPFLTLPLPPPSSPFLTLPYPFSPFLTLSHPPPSSPFLPLPHPSLPFLTLPLINLSTHPPSFLLLLNMVFQALFPSICSRIPPLTPVFLSTIPLIPPLPPLISPPSYPPPSHFPSLPILILPSFPFLYPSPPPTSFCCTT